MTDGTSGDGDVMAVERWVLVASILGSRMAFIGRAVRRYGGTAEDVPYRRFTYRRFTYCPTAYSSRYCAVETTRRIFWS